MSEVNGQLLPAAWVTASLEAVIGPDGIFCDGDWVESKDQDPSGDVRLVQLADVGDGDYRNRSNRFLTSAKAAELRCTFIKRGDLLIARMPDPLGRVCIFPGDAKPSVTVVDVCIVRPESEVSSRWLMHQLNTPQMRRRVAELQSGTTRKRISRANLATVSFPVAPVPEQQRIAETLDELLSDLDAGVAALGRARAKLKHYRAAVLKAAVEGTLTAEWRSQHPGAEPASALLTRILAERRRLWEEAQLQKFQTAEKSLPKDWKSKYPEPTAPDTTNLPPLPRGWCWATIEQLTTELANGFGKRSQERGAPRIVLRLADIKGGEVGYGNVRKINCTTDDINRYGLKEEDLLILRVNGSAELVGRFVLIRHLPDQLLFCDHFIRARCVMPRSAVWLRAYSDTASFRRHIDLKKVSSAGQNTISQATLSPLAIPMPPIEEQEAIVEAVEDQLSVIEHLEGDLEAKLKSARALRQSILRHAFTGQLVPQDPNDEPASELLKRIAADREERARLVKSAKQARPRTKVPRNRAAKS